MTARADLVEGVWAALDSVHDMDVSLGDYAEAVVSWLEQSGALRADVPADAPAIARTISHEFVNGIVVTAYVEDVQTPVGIMPRYCGHWSTPGKGAANVRRLFAEDDVMPVIASLRLQIANYQAELTELRLQVIASDGQAGEAYAAQLRAEADALALAECGAALNEQAWHVCQGACIRGMNIDESARNLGPLAKAFDKALDAHEDRLRAMKQGEPS